jgi:hypothetical protein
MVNQYLMQRLAGLRNLLIGVHQASAGMSSASKGHERAQFIDAFLSEVLPAIYRFGTGDATDSHGNRSGQLDVVIEHPFSPTLPVVGAGQSRLYLAEGVAAVLEVKSDLAGQWAEAVKTANTLAELKRAWGMTMTFGGGWPGARIPLYVVGYTGWKTIETLRNHVDAQPNIDGALVIDSGLYHSSSCSASGDASLWALICDLHSRTSTLNAAATKPLDYVLE